MKSLEFVELDIPYCLLRYGETTGDGTCPAILGTDSDVKCFNTKKTCAVRDSYLEDEVTLRFAKPTEYLPPEFNAIPSILDISFTPGTISLGENLGTRATLTVQFKDHPDSDTAEGLDKYFAERDYNPFDQGTFWGKFRARQPYLFGRSIRVIKGLVGQTLDQMETRHYVIDSGDGPTPDGKYTLVAKDVLKLVDGSKAQAPAMNSGFLLTNISNGTGGVTLSPSGVGNAEYPSSGIAVIAGKEVVTYTRSADTMTLTARGLLNTVAANANAQDRVQVVLSYSAADPADIIYDLMVNYAGIPASYINLAEWQAETGAFVARLYSANICEPTSVATLISELIQQACLCIWWDDIAQKIRLQVLRGILTDATRLTPDNTLKGSLTTKEQPEKRLSQVWTYFGQINPVKNLSDTDNYRSNSIVIDADAEEDYGSPVIKKVYSRWIPALGRSVADRFGEIQLSRYRDPPRRLTFDTQRYAGTDIQLGRGYLIASKFFQASTGALVDVPVQITRLNPPADRFKGEAEEMLFAVPIDTTRSIIIDSDAYNVNLRAAHDAIYPPPVSGTVVECRVLASVVVGSVSSSIPAFDVGSWPSGVIVKLILEGRIQGMGGVGGNGRFPFNAAGNGQPGGIALFTRFAVDLELPASGELWGGGGGGGGGDAANNTFTAFGGGGGGGAGRNPGLGGVSSSQNGQPGTASSGGAPGAGQSGVGASGGLGGGPGSPGGNGVFAFFGAGLGGAAGYAIDGGSFVTITVSDGNLLGPTIN